MKRTHTNNGPREHTTGPTVSGKMAVFTRASRRHVKRGLVVCVLCVLVLNLYLTQGSYLQDFVHMIGGLFGSPGPSWTCNGTCIIVWSSDFHIGPIQDLKSLLQPLNVRFIDKSLSSHCHLTDTCAAGRLRVINQGNGMDLSDPNLIARFHKAYQNDPEMNAVDTFVCFHPSAMCELYMSFGKSVIVIASTRYELGRFGAKRWQAWNDNLRKIAADPKNIVAGNNLYDAKYIQYFTGIEAQVLPSYCGYIDDKYVGNREGFLLAPIHKPGFQQIFMDGYNAACKKVDCGVKVFPLREKYAHYKYSDLGAHKGIIYVPYQVSVMSLFEQYRMNIPLFFPSKTLLVDWQYDHMIMNERTWDGILHGISANKSAIAPHPSQSHVPDPNCETNKTAIRYWIEYADFYSFPHITYYESYEDLVHKLESAKLTEISENMKLYNKKAKGELINKWKGILLTVAKYSPNNKTMYKAEYSDFTPS